MKEKKNKKNLSNNSETVNQNVIIIGNKKIYI